MKNWPDVIAEEDIYYIVYFLGNRLLEKKITNTLLLGC